MPTDPACTIRVAIIDDADLIVHGLARLLAPFPDRVTFLGRLDGDAPAEVDVVLCDVEARLEVSLLDLRTICHSTRAEALVFSWEVGPGLAGRFTTMGASGHVLKSATGLELVEAVERALHGLPAEPVTARPGRPLSADPNPTAAGAWPGAEHGLTRRESEVLCHITQGASNQEVAQRLYLSINSVKTYVRTGYRKIGVSRRADAVRWAIEHGFA